MKHILKLTFVLLLVTFGCSRLNDYDENAQVSVFVGFDVDKVSHSGTLKQSLDYDDPLNTQPAIIKVPYYNGGNQTIIIGEFEEGSGSMPAGLTVVGTSDITAVEQGVLDIPIYGAAENYGRDTLIFYISTGAREWTVTYPVNIVSASEITDDLIIEDAVLEAKVMRGVDMRINDDGERQITLTYSNGYGRKVYFSTEDASPQSLFTINTSSTSQFLVTSDAQTEVTLPVTGKYEGTETEVSVNVYAYQLDYDTNEVIDTTMYTIYDIPTYEPKYLNYWLDQVRYDGGSESIIYMNEPVNRAIVVNYESAENRNVTIKAEFDGGNNYGLEINASTSPYEVATVLNDDTGTLYIPISGTATTDGSDLFYPKVNVYISGDAISTALANTPMTYTFTIIKSEYSAN